MKIQTRSTIFAIAAFAALLTSAESAISMGDTSIRFVGGATLAYEDNVYMTSFAQVSDYRIEFDAGLEFQLAPNGAADTTLLVSERFVRYDTEPLNKNLLTAKFNTSYDSGVTLTNFYASYQENYSSRFAFNEVTDTFGVLVLRDTAKAGGNVKYGISELTSVKAGVDYSDTSYDSVNAQTANPFSGHEMISVPVTVFYKVRPKVDLTAGLRYRTTDGDNRVSYDDMYYYVGAVGELFSPVVHADITIGYQKRDASNGPDQTSGSYNASLIYTGNPKATAYATLSRDFRTSAVSAISYTYDSLSLGGSYAMSNKVGFNAAVIYGQSDYKNYDREEDIRMLRFGASYRANDNMSLSATYFYRDVDGNIANYSENEFRVTASLRY